MREKGLPAGVEVDIKGPRLREVLEKLLVHAKSFSFTDDQGTITPPYLFYAFDGLKKELEEAEAGQSRDEELIFELKSAITYVEEDFSNTFSALATLLPKGQITFDMLWAIFPPGESAVSPNKLGHLQSYLVRDGSIERRQDGSRYYLISADCIDCVGDLFGWTQKTLIIDGFPGVMDIRDLPYWPLTKHPDGDRVRTQLRKTGKDALKLHGRKLVEYDGHAIHEVFRGDEVVKERYLPQGRVMLDPSTLHSIVPESKLLPHVKTHLRRDCREDQNIEFVSQLVYGFSLGDKTWGAFAVQQVRELQWNTDAFNLLVLRDEQKDFLRDLVIGHQNHKKGRLRGYRARQRQGSRWYTRGPSGCRQKVIAETTEKALYTVSSGELGETPTSILKKLKYIMQSTEAWNAVLLLDEADVFLAERGDDLARNAIISVFLRELEYYQGIMILTTNRITNIDSAFQNRIHFGLEYPDLDTIGRAEIWSNFIRQAIKQSDLEVDVDEDDILQLASLNLNGRQIKNALSLSQAVARKRKQPLSAASIRSALRLSQHFQMGPSLGTKSAEAFQFSGNGAGSGANIITDKGVGKLSVHGNGIAGNADTELGSRG